MVGVPFGEHKRQRRENIELVAEHAVKLSVFPPFFSCRPVRRDPSPAAQVASARSIAKDETNIRSGPSLQSEIPFTAPRLPHRGAGAFRQVDPVPGLAGQLRLGVFPPR